MDRRKFLKSGALAVAGVCLLKNAARAQTAIVPSTSADSGQIGKMSSAEFARLNAKGASDVSAVSPTPAALSDADAALMRKVAAGGMMQLEASRLALGKASVPDVRALADAEVKEQTGLKAKLLQIATLKHLTLPEGPDERTLALLERLRSLSGAEFDRAYLREVGIAGHELLDQTMTQVETDATDVVLKTLAIAAHPLVRTHLEVARIEAGELPGTIVQPS